MNRNLNYEHYLFWNQCEVDEPKHSIEMKYFQREGDLIDDMNDINQLPFIYNHNFASYEAQKAFMFVESNNEMNLENNVNANDRHTIAQEQECYENQSDISCNGTESNFKSFRYQYDDHISNEVDCITKQDTILQMQLLNNHNEDVEALDKELSNFTNKNLCNVKLINEDGTIFKEESSPLKSCGEEDKEIQMNILSEPVDVISSVYNNKSLFRRWGKEKDRKAFKLLQEMCKNLHLSFEKFILVDENEIINKHNFEFTNEVYSRIIGEIGKEFNWIRKPVHLFYRFKKIYSQSESKLSIRDTRLLKSILINNIGKKINDEEILFHFPGKSKSVIQKTAKYILSNL